MKMDMRMDMDIFTGQMSGFAKAREKFLFIIDFEFRKPIICKLKDAEEAGILYDIKGNSNTEHKISGKRLELKSYPIDKQIFSDRFNKVISHLKNGDSYLMNLTFPTPIDINLTPAEIFHVARAPYKLLYKDNLVVFSPECFIKTENNTVFTYPMKGTIDAAVDNAENVLMANRKEEWEHNTIVDLLRNDLSMISRNVTVTKFRYPEIIRTNNGDILQTSSEITGELPEGWQSDLGTIIQRLLPAGSVSGAPKKKTLEIIENIEIEPRGYYTGIFGIFDGINLDCAVSIRYIEWKNNKAFFRSGGGITARSIMDEEYAELIRKIYVPTI